jgi:DNA-binding response OmpR family regulator
MMVDDDPAILTIYSILLERTGFAVLTAQDASAALDLLEDTTPGVFVLDVMMPGIDGIELCRQLRARPETSQTPVIFLSARGDVETRAHADAAGGDAYLVKPIQPHTLLEHIHGLLGEREAGPVV